MAAVAEAEQLAAVLALGDNFYPHGICNRRTHPPCAAATDFLFAGVRTSRETVVRLVILMRGMDLADPSLTMKHHLHTEVCERVLCFGPETGLWPRDPAQEGLAR